MLLCIPTGYAERCQYIPTGCADERCQYIATGCADERCQYIVTGCADERCQYSCVVVLFRPAISNVVVRLLFNLLVHL